MTARDVVFTEIYLAPRNYALLREWVNRPVAKTKHGHNGGMQRRRLDWRDRMDAIHRSVRLTTHSSFERGTVDDMTWIARTIINRNGGGYQTRIAEIFEDTHPLFTGLPIKPRSR